MATITQKHPQRKSIQDYEDAIDRQFAKLERIDEEDQSSYKIIEFELRNMDAMMKAADLKIKFHDIKQRAVLFVDAVDRRKEKEFKKLKGGNKELLSA